jgi:hypothetical protein
MAKYQIRDVLKVKQKETIILKSALPGGNRTKKIAVPDAENSLNRPSRINLKPLRGEHRGIWVANRQKHLDSIRSLHPPKTFHLVPTEKIFHSDRSRLVQPFKIAVYGLVIVLAINLFNVLAAGMQFKSVLVSSASSGFDSLVAGVKQGQNLSLSQAENDFRQASTNFEKSLEKISFLKTSSVFANENNTSSLQNLLRAGQKISGAGQLFSQSARNLQNWPDLFLQTNRNLALGQISPAGAAPLSLTDSLKADLANVDTANQQLSSALQDLDNVNSSILPSPYREALPEIRESLRSLTALLSDISANFPAVLELLGDRYPHRYLVLLQNDTEARPTGGFIGSLLIVDVNDGVIENAEFHDVYQYDGQLNEEIDAPEDIAQITRQWRLRDSNYSPDFALSAEKAAWFLQKSKGPSVDTVIAINQSAIGDLLAETGPIRVEGLQGQLDANNFQFMLGYLIESKHYGASNPKAILEKTIQAFKEKIVSASDPHALLKTLAQAARDQKILFYSRDAKVQSLFEKLHLTPHQTVLEPDEDYLQVLATSIGGNKSDLYITQNLTHTTFIDPSGALTDELTITRKHNWTGAELYRWEKILKDFGFGEMPEHLRDILGKGTNKASLKVYVPLGAELENTLGIETAEVLTRHDAELQKTYFLLQLSVAPGEDKSVTLRYKLPRHLDLIPSAIYRFTAQKQISNFPTQLKKVLVISPVLTLLKNSQNGLEYSTKLRDEYRMRAIVVN